MNYLEFSLNAHGSNPILIAADHIVTATPRADGGTDLVVSTGFGVISVLEDYKTVSKMLLATAAARFGK